MLYGHFTWCHVTEAVVCPLLASKAFQPCIQDTLSSRAALGLPLYTRYPIVAHALGRVRARAKESCIQGLPAVQPSGRVRRASKGIFHTNFNPTSCGVDIRCMVYTTIIRAPAKGGKYYSVISGIKRISTCVAIRYQRSKFTSIEPMITASDPFRKSLEFDGRVI